MYIHKGPPCVILLLYAQKESAAGIQCLALSSAMLCYICMWLHSTGVQAVKMFIKHYSLILSFLQKLKFVDLVHSFVLIAVYTYHSPANNHFLCSQIFML